MLKKTPNQENPNTDIIGLPNAIRDILQENPDPSLEGSVIPLGEENRDSRPISPSNSDTVPNQRAQWYLQHRLKGHAYMASIKRFSVSHGELREWRKIPAFTQLEAYAATMSNLGTTAQGVADMLLDSASISAVQTWIRNLDSPNPRDSSHAASEIVDHSAWYRRLKAREGSTNLMIIGTQAPPVCGCPGQCAVHTTATATVIDVAVAPETPEAGG
jgi:hypothetical protein